MNKTPNIYRVAKDLIDATPPWCFTAYTTNVSGNGVQFENAAGSTDGVHWPSAEGIAAGLAPGDPVLVVRAGAGYVVLCKIVS